MKCLGRILAAMIAVVALGYAGWFSDTPHTPKKVPAVALDIAYEKSEAYLLLGDEREAIGLNRLESDAVLERAAQAHADYLIRNGVSSHYETETKSGFTGRRPVDRALAAGYRARFVGENLTTDTPDAKHAVQGLMSAIYHRLTFLRFDIDEVGIGVAQNDVHKEKTAFVFEVGNATLARLCTEEQFRGYGAYVYGVCKEKEHRIEKRRYDEAKEVSEFNPMFVVYPYDGQEGVSPVFYEEEPDPLPDVEVSGFPVSISFNPFKVRSVTMREFTLKNINTGKEVVAATIMDASNDPNHTFSPLQFAFFPRERLAYDTEYEARFVGEADGNVVQERWRFHTVRPEGKVIRIVSDEAHLRLKRNTPYILYFVPRDGHDLIREMTFPDGVETAFVDHNTLRLYISDKSDDTIALHGSGKKVRIDVVR